MNNNNPNTRILIAIVLSLLFLIPYMYFFSPKTQTNQISNSANKTIQENSAPVSNVKSINNQTKAPTSSSTIIAKIVSKEVDIEIDELGRISNVFLKDKKFLNEDGKPLGLLNKDSIKPLEMRFSDSTINQKAFN